MNMSIKKFLVETISVWESWIHVSPHWQQLIPKWATARAMVRMTALRFLYVVL